MILTLILNILIAIVIYYTSDYFVMLYSVGDISMYLLS